MSDQLLFLLQNLHHLLIGFPGQRPGGLLMSIILAVISIGLGFILAIPLARLQTSGVRLVRGGAKIMVDVFRGLPLILLLVFIFQVIGSGRYGIVLQPREAAILSLALYSAAYQAEILRSGLEAVPSQHTDTGRMLGSTAWQRFCHIQLPHVWITMRPAMVGQAISLFKDTSVVIVVGMSELMMSARVLLGNDITNAPYWIGVYLTVGLLYFCGAFALSRVAQTYEKTLYRTLGQTM